MRYPKQQPFDVAMRNACPRCGKGALYDGFLKIKSRCDVCDLDLAKADSGDGPAVFLIFFIGLLAVGMIFIFRFGFDMSVGLTLLLSLGISAALTALVIRQLKSFMVAQQYAQKAHEATKVENQTDKDWQGD